MKIIIIVPFFLPLTGAPKDHPVYVYVRAIIGDIKPQARSMVSGSRKGIALTDPASATSNQFGLDARGHIC